jgi:uncharacterized membrane protein YeaQ/YmgE (transglycosylase-associated protein family)
MTLGEFIILLIISAIAGLIGQQLAGYKVGGLLMAIVIGFVGAVLGLFLARELDLPLFFVIDVGQEEFPVIWSVVGAAILALGLSLFTRRGGRRLI